MKGNKVIAKQRIGKEAAFPYYEDSDEDFQEAKKMWELGKQLGLYVKMEEVVIEKLTKLRRSFKARTTPTCLGKLARVLLLGDELVV